MPSEDQYCLCEPGYKLNKIHSIWDHPSRIHKTDRVYDLQCARIESPEHNYLSTNTGIMEHPYQYPNQTTLTENFSICFYESNQSEFSSSGNYEFCNSSFMVGMESKYFPRHNDRWFYFTFQSYDPTEWELNDCEISEHSKMDLFRKDSDLTLKKNQVIAGLKSVYNTTHVDRTFGFYICKFVMISKGKIKQKLL